MSGPLPGRHRSRRRHLRPWRLLLTGVLLAAAVLLAKVAVNRRPGENVAQSIATTVLGPQPTNILLIGNNARGASSPLAPGQADLMFVLHVDPVKHEVVFISIPRNVMVAFPGWRDPIPKVKGAFFMGGPTLALQTVSKLVGMPVHDYVAADFSGFVQAVNDIGGLSVDVQQAVYDPTHSHAVFSPGVQHMDGAQVLAYVRVRQNQAGNGYRVNDFQRMDAAFGILAALRRQALRRLSTGEITNLLNLWQRDVATNLTRSQIVALAMGSLHARFVQLTIGSLRDSMVLPSTPLPGVNAEGAVEGAFYDILTPQEIEAELAPYGAVGPVTGLPPLPAPSAVHVLVGAGGANLVAELRQAGIEASSGGVSRSPGATLVLYPPGGLEAAEVVGRAIGQSNEQLVPAHVTGIEVEPGG